MKCSPLSLLTSIFICVIMFSCRAMKDPDFRSIENLRLQRADLNESTLFLDIRYFNPNRSGMKLKDAKGDAYLDGVLLGRFKMDTLINIPANAEFTLPIKMTVNMKDILQNSISSFLGNEVTIKIDGKAKVGKGGVFIRYPIHYEGKQNLSELLKQNRSLLLQVQ